MNLYPLLRPALFSLDPELAHQLTLKSLKLLQQSGLAQLLPAQSAPQPLTVMGLNFKNPVGLAAGMDKNGDYIDALCALGFGFIEIGTVTPRPQAGNPKPRLFRLPEHQAIINRMGFNNAGVDYLLRQVKGARNNAIIGINIAKNLATPIEDAVADYLICLRKSYAAASYITLNVSSPNSKNLRQLQHADAIKRLLSALKEEQLKLAARQQKYTPLVVKIAPDLSDAEITTIAQLLGEFAIDGVLATNTTVARNEVQAHRHAKQAGGLSGAPLTEQATSVVARLAAELKGTIPIIAVGGILSGQDAQDKLDAGASLVQIYSGLIYRGPQLIEDILQTLRA